MPGKNMYRVSINHLLGCHGQSISYLSIHDYVHSINYNFFFFFFSLSLSLSRPSPSVNCHNLVL